MTTYSTSEISEKFNSYKQDIIRKATAEDLQNLTNEFSSSSKTFNEMARTSFATLGPGYYKKIGNLEYVVGQYPTHRMQVLYFPDFETDYIYKKNVNIGPLVNTNAIARLTQDITGRALWDEFLINKSVASQEDRNSYYKAQKELFFNNLFAHTSMFNVHKLDTETAPATCTWSTII